MSGEALSNARALLSSALSADERGQRREAKELYEESVAVCINAIKETSDESVKDKLGKLAKQALDRGEEIKKMLSSSPRASPAASPKRSLGPLGVSLRDERAATATATATASTGGGGARGNLSEEEKKVLAITSRINKRDYVPFMSVDLGEKFNYNYEKYSDPHGKLALAPKQKSRLKAWKRPHEFMRSPKALELVDCFSVKQTVVSDCSFVASIAISAQYEKRFGKKLITSIIYPQRNGVPYYNEGGKYMVKLRVNGIPRKVVIDDYFPVGPSDEPLCSYSSNRNELWISILEKAYMKVMGGYDFPGSNSNIDLYSLTGWIPERVSVRPDDPSFDKDGVFRKLHERFHRGDVLVTVATGEMSEEAGERAGLVPTHAYAMLNVREVDGVRLFLLKNPWAHLRWKGNYSENDARHWTPAMMKALDYDPKAQQNFDNGVFWIDYDSLCRFFDVIYMNWNPALFPHSTSVHQGWNAGSGPAKDLYNISNNPQFSLELGSGQGALWILLSRHITDIADFRDNKEYITVLVYKNDGKKVYYPFDPPPYIDGVRINSPHYLCKVTVGPNTPRKMTLVVSQYEKSTTIYFTLRVYSTIPFDLKKIPNPYKLTKTITSQWSKETAGGCANYKETHAKNPKFQFTTDTPNQLLIELKAPKEFQVGFDLSTVISSVDRGDRLYFKSKQSGLYRSGYTVLPIEVAAGTYTIVPSTFRPGQMGPFSLKVESTHPLNFVT